MTRLIDTQDAFNVLTDYYHHNSSTQHLALQEALNKVPTVDAVPSETLYGFIREIGAITYGKERFSRLARVKIFNEEIGARCSLWYDRKSCEWITTQTAMEECLKAVRELDADILCAGI